MGAGASAGLSEDALRSASVGQLTEVCNSLSPDLRQKLQDALIEVSEASMYTRPKVPTAKVLEAERPLRGCNMAALVEIFGETLKSKSGDQRTVEALAAKGAIAVYFSASWCQPCCNFTPDFARWYTETFSAKGLEVVLVSSDDDEAAFNTYYGKQPWLALPFSEGQRKQALLERFGVESFPTVIILDGNGVLVNREGFSALSRDPHGEHFPWKTFDLPAVLQGAKVLSPNGEVHDISSLQGKATALYFGAFGCSMRFTRELSESYNASLKHKGLDIVYIPSDESENDFVDHFAQQPWHTLDYSDSATKRALRNMLDVKQLPCLVIVDRNGAVINKDGYYAVLDDPEGTNFPWHPKPVHNLRDGPGTLTGIPTVVAFCEGCGTHTQKAIEAAMKPVGERFLASRSNTVTYRTAGSCFQHTNRMQEFAFTIVTEAHAMGADLRHDMGLPRLAESESGAVKLPVQLMLVDIPDQGGFYEGPGGEITEDTVFEFVLDYKRKRLARKQLKD